MSGDDTAAPDARMPLRAAPDEIPLVSQPILRAAGIVAHKAAAN